MFLLNPRTPTGPLATPAVVCTGGSATLTVDDRGPGIVIDWFTNSCGGTLIGTGNPLIVNPIGTTNPFGISTTYFARARRTSDGATSDACTKVTVSVRACQCNPADIADTAGSPRPDGSVDNGDFSLFFTAFFAATCPACGTPTSTPCNPADLADTAGTPGPDGCVDNGDFSLFFTAFFAGC